jgi:hypothetical protein
MNYLIMLPNKQLNYAKDTLRFKDGGKKFLICCVNILRNNMNKKYIGNNYLQDSIRNSIYYYSINILY